MSPIMKSCLGVGSQRCGKLIPQSQVRCPQHKYEHQRTRDLIRGTPASRGYDRAYRRLRLEVLDEAGYICTWCGRFGADTADHLIPTSRGGTSDRDNLVAAHRSCNSSRGAPLARRRVGGRGRDGFPTFDDRPALPPRTHSTGESKS